MKSYKDCDDARAELHVDVACCKKCHNGYLLPMYPTEPKITTVGKNTYLTCCKVHKHITKGN